MKKLLKAVFQPAKAWEAGYASDNGKNPFWRLLKWMAFEDGHAQAMADKTGYKGNLPLLGSHLADMAITIAAAEIVLVTVLKTSLYFVVKFL